MRCDCWSRRSFSDFAAEDRVVAEHLFDAQKLIVFGDAIGAAK